MLVRYVANLTVCIATYICIFHDNFVVGVSPQGSGISGRLRLRNLIRRHMLITRIILRLHQQLKLVLLHPQMLVDDDLLTLR